MSLKDQLLNRQFDYRQIDNIIHGRVRLAVMTSLNAAEVLSFNELKAVVGGSDGNLFVHIRRLTDAGYLDVERAYSGHKMLTLFSLTSKGRTALAAYVARMYDLLRIE